ncbi:MAG: XTP/dITP diphosphatase [Gemmatimonadota bacterium]|nr:MAG: XTP/dITP diphosphatase [Gemmatimonadota bacterium]
MDLLVATRSAHKMAEIRRILADLGAIRLLSLADLGLSPQPAEDGLEPYDTFEANARSKAAYFRSRSGLTTVADDSGIVVDLLDGAPGVRSKRFAPGAEDLDGPDQDEANNIYLVASLSEAPAAERAAHYVCVAVLDTGEGEPVVFEGKAHGVILTAPRGSGGFGYDPLFYDEELGRTFAEISQDTKNEHSHRGRAFRALAKHLESELDRS